MKKFIFFIVCYFGLHVSIFAQWQQTCGPMGGDASVNSIAINGNNIFAGTDKGVYLSVDNGEHWSTVNSGLSDTWIHSLAISGSNIFAATGSGVFLSTNNGEYWTAVNNDIFTSLNIQRLAISGKNIFVGTSNNGVFISTDNGGLWTAVNNGLTNSTISAFAISGNNIYAGGTNLYLSSNNGQNWSVIDSGFQISNNFQNNITSIAINDSNIFVGTNLGVFLSTNIGKNWTALNIGTTNVDVNALAVYGKYVFVATNGALYQSIDNGQNWNIINIGEEHPNVFSLAICDSTIFAGTGNIMWETGHGGLFSSKVNSNSWEEIGLPTSTVNSLAVNGSIICAAIQGGPDVCAGNGVYLSTNNGNSWSIVDKFSNYFSNEISIAKSGNYILAGTYGGIYSSLDNGKSWIVLDSIPTFVTSLVVSGSSIFAGIGNGKDCGGPGKKSLNIPFGSIFVSTNNGKSWSVSDSGIPKYRYITSLATNGNNIFAGSDTGMFLSTNNGLFWNEIGLPYYIGSIVISNNNIYVLSFGDNGGIFLTTNNGQSWSSITSDFPKDNYTFFTSLTINGSNIFAGTNSGVFLSANNGKLWTALNTGLPSNAFINSLAINENFIFAGISGLSVWKRPLTDIVSIKENSYKNNFKLYPNPANTSLTIQSEKSVQYKLTLSNLQGQKVFEKSEIFESSYNLNVSNIINGIYILSLQNSSEQLVQKVVVQH